MKYEIDLGKNDHIPVSFGEITLKILEVLRSLFPKKPEEKFLETEKDYIEKIVRRGSVLLLHVDIALTLLEESERKNLSFSGVEAFRILGDKIQPAMEFSNISFGQTALVDGEIKFLGFERKVKKSWEEVSDVYRATKEMMAQGAAAGYDHYEVSITDKRSGQLMFFNEKFWNSKK